MRKLPNKSIAESVKNTQKRRLVNSEYQRGFMEGQQQAALDMAISIENILRQHNHVAVMDYCLED